MPRLNSAEVVLDRVGVDGRGALIVAHVFVLRCDPRGRGWRSGQAVLVELRRVGHDGGFLRDVGVDDRDDLGHGAASDVVAAHAAAAFDQRHDQRSYALTDWKLGTSLGMG